MQVCQQLLYRGHFGCTRNTIECLRRRFRVIRNVADRPRSGRPRVTTAADGRYIVLQHLHNRRLTAAATGRQYGIQKSVETKRSTYSFVPTALRSNSHPTSSNGQGEIGAAVTCTSDVLIGI